LIVIGLLKKSHSINGNHEKHPKYLAFCESLLPWASCELGEKTTE
jgi:hypothetical protein